MIYLLIFRLLCGGVREDAHPMAPSPAITVSQPPTPTLRPLFKRRLPNDP